VTPRATGKKIQKKNDVIRIQVDFEDRAVRKVQKGACAAATLASL